MQFLSARRWYLAAGLGLSAGVGFAADPPKKAAGHPVSAVPSTNALGLGECLALGAARQPAVAAAAAGHASSVAGYDALNNLPMFAKLFSPDVPVRKMQAVSGLAVSQAEIHKTLQENEYDVARLYFSYVYARQQEITAADVLEQIDVFYEIAKELLKQGATPKVNQFTIYAMEEAIVEVKKLKLEAATGQKLALAALKEAMGVGQAFDFVPKDPELPVMGGTVTEQQVIDQALARRPELAQAAAGVDAFRLEICAQDKVRFRQTVPTLAAGSDLHAKMVPAAVRNGEYKPGAVSPEMPNVLVGKREDRVRRAAALSARQDAVYEKARELITLEAVNAYLGWKSAAERLDLAKDQFERAKKMVKLSRDNAPNIREYDVLVRNEAMAGKAQAEYLKAVFEHILALARLQRVTAGGVVPDFPK